MLKNLNRKMNTKERIAYFCRVQGISVASFERACGLSVGYVSAMRKSVGLRSLAQIQAAYPELRRDWLLYGEGDMLNKNVTAPGDSAPVTEQVQGSGDPGSSPVSVPDVVIPGAAWVVIQQQSASLERKDRQLDRCISMLETSFALLKGAAVPAAASVAAAGESAG